MSNKKPVTLDHLKSLKKPVITRAVIAGDNEVAEEYEQAKNELDYARIRYEARPEVDIVRSDFEEAKKRFEAAKKRAQETALVFKFRSIGRKKYEALLDKHQPTEEQIEEFESRGGKRDQLSFNPDTFPLALIAASSFEPEMTIDDVKELWDSDADWNTSELALLFEKAYEANTAKRILDLGKG